MSKQINIIIEQGTDFSRTFALTDEYGDSLDLTGYTTASVMSASVLIPGSAITAELTDEINGELTLSLTATQTAALSPGRYLYYANITSAPDDDALTVTTRVLEGMIEVRPSPTLPPG
jgi:hypothetical protein